MTIEDFAEIYMDKVETRTKKAAIGEVKAFLATLKDILVENKNIQLAGLGTLDMKLHAVPAGERYNPVKGKKEKFKEHMAIRAHFRPSKELKVRFCLGANVCLKP